MSDLIAAFTASLRRTHPFTSLPVSRLPHEDLWTAYNRAVMALRLPLHHARLGKARPKDKAFDEAVQSGLAMLAAFAHVADTHQAIVRFDDDECTAISFQPRPWGANWTAKYALSPTPLHNPDHDPLTEHRRQPQVSTLDILHLAPRTARAYLKAEQLAVPNGTVTFEFSADDHDNPSTLLIYRERGDDGARKPARYASLRAVL